VSNVFKTFILLAGLTALFMLVGRALGGQHGMMVALFFAAVMNFFAYWFSDKMALSMSGAQPVSEAEAPELRTPCHSCIAGCQGRASQAQGVHNSHPDAQCLCHGQKPRACGSGCDPGHNGDTQSGRARGRACP